MSCECANIYTNNNYLGSKAAYSSILYALRANLLNYSLLGANLSQGSGDFPHIYVIISMFVF